nr:fimbria/pilus periplasmic chaperone [Klebsiella pneumoniae subsp. pneumoniae]
MIKADVFATPDGRNTQTDPKSAVPFMVTPPLFRLEPNSQNSVLIVRNGAAQLPADRESVFYLSFWLFLRHQMPPKGHSLVCQPVFQSVYSR